MHEQILDALRRGAHDEALAAARAAVDADPNDIAAYRLLAQVLRAGGDHIAALDAIDSAIALAPDDAGLHFHRAGLLLGERDQVQAQQALEQAVKLDPNQLGAYLVQAELALGRGDADEAERLARLAERVAPEHPHLLAIEAMIALARDDRSRALARITLAQSLAPDDPRVLNTAGFVYLRNDNHAFAEQAFRRLHELHPEHPALGRMLAMLLSRQGRTGEALEAIEPTLDASQPVTPESLRFAGELALRLGDPARAEPWLRRALAAMPADRRSLEQAMRVWSLLGDVEGARNALEALLSTSPQIDLLWSARTSVETTAAAAAEVVGRWLAAMPDSVRAHQTRMEQQFGAGDHAGAEVSACRIIELAPDHLHAHGRLLDLLMLRDQPRALTHVQALSDRLGSASGPGRQVRGWLARIHDLAGEHVRALEIWTARHAGEAAGLMPLPAAGVPDAPRAPAAAPAADAPARVFLSGLPGSGVARVARLLGGGLGTGFGGDRFGPRPPADPFQNLDLSAALAAGKVAPEAVAAQWRQALPARGLATDGPVLDWLPLWDNALLDVIAPHLPRARVLIALRDPRDMLLDWLAFGAGLPLRLESPELAAQWLAQMLEHVAVLHERDLHPHALLRLDDSINAPAEMAAVVGTALGVNLPAPPEQLFDGHRHRAGHWRRYAGPLQAAFASLTPVAVRLGYPET